MAFVSPIDASDLDGDGGFVANGQGANRNSGAAVAGAGDLNGDGVDDLAIGGPNGAGLTYVVFGRSAGFTSPVELSALSGGDGFVVRGEAGGDMSGFSVDGAGDVNDDGIADLIVGAPFADEAGVNRGASYVVFGRTGGFGAAVELTAVAAGSGGFAIFGGAANDAAGIDVAGAGDVNDDGIADLIVGASFVSLGGSNAGAAYVVFGRSGGFAGPVHLSALAPGEGFVMIGGASDDRAGGAVAGAGDVNGDGIDDVIVGAVYGAGNIALSGTAYVVFGRTAVHLAPIALSALDGSLGFVLLGGASRDGAGGAVAGAGDVNGDEFDDLVVGASNAGAAYVVFGRTTGFAASIDLTALDGADGFVARGGSAGDGVGVSVDGAGDVNGDGVDDLIVGADGLDANGPQSGGAYVLFGRTGGFAPLIDLSALDGSTGFVFNAGPSDNGRAVAGAGDLDGDDIADVVVGATAADPNGSNSGRSYVIFGHPPPPDATPPDAPTVDAIADDTGTPGDGVTSDRTLTVSGTAEPLSTVHVFRGAVEIGTTAADADGDWSFADPATLPYGGHLYRAEAEDDAGNVSERSAPLQVFVVNPATLPSSGPDLVLGSMAASQIQGGGGNDTIFGEAGNDTLKGNEGNDWLFGGEDADRLEGENGHDVLRGGNANDTVYGQNGKDTLAGENGNDRLEGGADADSIDGGAGADTIYGGASTDTLVGGAGGDRLYGDADPDWLDLGDDTARDTVFGSIAHLADDTIDGFVGGTPATPGADLLLISGLTNAQAKKLDGDVLDAQGRLSLAEVGGGSITFEGHGGATVDAIFTAGGVQVWLL